MRAGRTKLEHGAALRVPPAREQNGWSVLLTWVGGAGYRLDPETLVLETEGEALMARSGDWVVLCADGAFHVGRPAEPRKSATVTRLN
ncbi:MAG: hypothetical protein JWO33_810 [Caulobacteraceae bacterium]|nr:hypothetical protein [Caulobacteraceae bacterium]